MKLFETTVTTDSLDPTYVFLSPKREGLSAVLYAAHHVQNWPELNGREVGSDFRLFHNPFARTRLPIGYLQRGEDWGVADGFFRCLNIAAATKGTG